MFYEGSEKKAEIIVNSKNLSLLNDIDDAFWHTLVQCCNAQVLSTIHNASCKAFLLSESSLFVWHDRLLILTCGVTQLVKSVEFLINEFGVGNIQHLIYQRKNEYFAHKQASSFNDDVHRLSQCIPGKAYRFGELDSHHNYVFHIDNDYQACRHDKTYEFLAYQISPQASAKLCSPELTSESIRNYLQVDLLLPNFQIDDFIFEPYGYSLNAINNDRYLTIHVTPQAGSSYVSVETNINLLEELPLLIDILQPASFDLLSFNEINFQQITQMKIPPDYVSKSKVTEQFNSGYNVCFASFLKPQTHFTSATRLK